MVDGDSLCEQHEGNGAANGGCVGTELNTAAQIGPGPPASLPCATITRSNHPSFRISVYNDVVYWPHRYIHAINLQHNLSPFSEVEPPMLER